MVFLAICLLLGAFFLFLQASRQKKAAGLPGGRIIYSDTRGWGPLEKPITDPMLNLTGKPDYIRREGEELIPVERKSRIISPAGAYEGEILQLAAYCLLVEERFGKPVRRGHLLYLNRSLEIAFDDQLRRRLFGALGELKTAEAMSDVPRSHNSPARCRGCGFRKTCPDSLASA